MGATTAQWGQGMKQKQSAQDSVIPRHYYQWTPPLRPASLGNLHDGPLPPLDYHSSHEMNLSIP